MFLSSAQSYCAAGTKSGLEKIPIVKTDEYLAGFSSLDKVQGIINVFQPTYSIDISRNKSVFIAHGSWQ
jgi:hypothetical protein